MRLIFKKLDLPAENQMLVDWLSSSAWPFHGNTNLPPERIQQMIQDGFFDGSNHQTFWVLNGQARIGYIRLFDLDDIGDGIPLFDVRIKPENRGQGIGRHAVSWLVNYMFQQWPELHRIEGTTRHDNLAMQRVFQKCNFVKEGHLRRAWKSNDGQFHDTIVFGILREDWMAGKAGSIDGLPSNFGPVPNLVPDQSL